MDKMKIYNNLPIWLQNLACSFEGLRIKRTRYGKIFWESLAEYESRNNWSYDQLCDYRDARLRKMIRHCYATVPYYTKLFNEGGINPDSIKTLDDLKVLPILTKSIVNAHPEEFISSSFDKNKLLTYHTSGTTGTGFIFKLTQQSICEQWAVWWRFRRRLGIDFGTWSGNFGTRLIVPITQTKPPFWRENKPCRQTYFSAFHQKPEFLDYYIKFIKEKKITWLHGYPSILTTLANRILETGTKLEDIKFVTLGAENLLEYQKEALTKAFGTAPYQHYGMSEGVANFSQYPNQTMIVDEDYAAVEFIPLGNNSSFKIIGTTLTNYAMPLLRWDMRDTATYKENSSKGRIITSIDGRIEDYVTLPNGTKVGKLDHVFKDTVKIKEAQIRQNSDYSLEIFYCSSVDNVDDDIALAMKILHETLGNDIPIKFVKVPELKKTPNGKLRFIVSEIK